MGVTYLHLWITQSLGRKGMVKEHNHYFCKFLNTPAASVYTWGLLKLGRSYAHKTVSVVLKLKAQSPTPDVRLYGQGIPVSWFTGPPSSLI